jgi:superfamily II DNA helicase RecQ
MELHVLTLRLDPDTGAFPARPLASIPGELLSVAEHFFFHEGWPHLLLTAQFRPPRVGRSDPSRGRKDPRDALTDAERAVYERVRLWRKARAEADGMPPFAILNNRQLVELVQARPTTIAGLRKIRGIGEAKAKSWGADVLAVLAEDTVREGSDG